MAHPFWTPVRPRGGREIIDWFDYDQKSWQPSTTLLSAPPIELEAYPMTSLSLCIHTKRVIMLYAPRDRERLDSGLCTCHVCDRRMQKLGLATLSGRNMASRRAQRNLKIIISRCLAERRVHVLCQSPVFKSARKRLTTASGVWRTT